MTDIGRAGIVMKGDYNSASTYETLDAVSFQNGLYVAKQNVPAGIVPTNTTYWQSAIDNTTIETEVNAKITGITYPGTSNMFVDMELPVANGGRCLIRIWKTQGKFEFYMSNSSESPTWDYTWQGTLN